MWHKGFCHYHTGFNPALPKGQRISPKGLAENFKNLGVSFAFCAGDHGDPDTSRPKTGKGYWGIDVREFKDYRAACLSLNENSGVVLIPAPEIHLMFPPFIYTRHEHHTCVPILDYVPSLELPPDPAFAASCTRKVAGFIFQAHKHNVSLTLNHPWNSMLVPLFCAPDPLSIPTLHRLDYLELFAPDFSGFSENFDIYLKFLARPVSAKMACCAAVDNCTDSFISPSEQGKVKILPFTYLYIQGGLTKQSLMAAWNERRSYVSGGLLQIESMEPIPSKMVVKTIKKPFITLRVKNRPGKKIKSVDIYRNGRKVYHDGNCRKDGYDLKWEDKNPLQGKNQYIVHIQAGEKHLVTSPINFAKNSPD